MKTIEEKIAEITKLFATDVITKEEFTAIVEILKNTKTSEPIMSPEGKKYDDYFQNYILPKFQSPATATYPPYDPSMITTVDGAFKSYKVIETYVDSQNGFGALTRSKIRILLGDNFEFNGCKLKSPIGYGWISF